MAQIAQEEEIELGRSMSEPFVASLAELVYAQAGESIRSARTLLRPSPAIKLFFELTPERINDTYILAEHLALELKAFAAHAGRSTIREEDVKLVCRKSSVLVSVWDIWKPIPSLTHLRP